MHEKLKMFGIAFAKAQKGGKRHPNLSFLWIYYSIGEKRLVGCIIQNTVFSQYANETYNLQKKGDQFNQFLNSEQ